MPPRNRRASNDPPSPDGENGSPPPSEENETPRASVRRDRPYLIAQRETFLSGASFGAATAPVDFDALVAQIKADPQFTFEREIAPTGLAALALTPLPLQRVVVARMSDDKAQELAQRAGLLVEYDAPLEIAELAPPVPVVDEGKLDPLALLPFGTTTTWSIRVQDAAGRPVAGASVSLSGSGFPVQGLTDEEGLVSITLMNDSDDTLKVLQVMPQRDHWSLLIANPVLTSGGPVNEFVLKPLSDLIAGFPDRQAIGWGQRAMRLDQIDPRFTGAGVKVAVIDSGADNDHPDLTNISRGQDFTVVPTQDFGWENDIQAHGSHCCGVVGARNNNSGIRGFAPDADLRACRVLPGGRFSSLLDSLDYCIAQELDVVNMSLGGRDTSEEILLKLRQAKNAGVACIVAAGNAGGPVLFPGTSPDVLTVAAVGKLSEFPPDSTHALRVSPGAPVDKGYFSASFSCHGPEVDLCAPGVAIVSSVPPDGFAAWDGTSMAAPHVAGLAALVLAHNPEFLKGGPFQQRNAARVDRLFQILKDSATPLNLGDPGRTGAGVPDAVLALSGRSAGASATGGQDIMAELLNQLRQDLVAVGVISPQR